MAQATAAPGSAHSAVAKENKKAIQARNLRTGLLFTAPALIVLAIFVFYPAIKTFITSLTSDRINRAVLGLRINGAVVGSGAAYSNDMLFSWAHRNRLDDSIASQADPSRTPEEGTTYNIRVYTSSNALLASALEVSSAASTGLP